MTQTKVMLFTGNANTLIKRCILFFFLQIKVMQNIVNRSNALIVAFFNISS